MNKAYIVEKTPWHTYFCNGPYQSGQYHGTKLEAQVECDLLNSVFETGFALGKKESPEVKEFQEMKHDIAHAYKCAKEYVPDYPWDESRQTASQSVYACGSAYEGTSAACSTWSRLFKRLAPKQYEELTKMEFKEYEELANKLEKEEKDNG